MLQHMVSEQEQAVAHQQAAHDGQIKAFWQAADDNSNDDLPMEDSM